MDFVQQDGCEHGRVIECPLSRPPPHSPLTPVCVEVLQVLEQLVPVVHKDVHNGGRLVGVGHKHLSHMTHMAAAAVATATAAALGLHHGWRIMEQVCRPGLCLGQTLC